jgi:hypothetical protein
MMLNGFVFAIIAEIRAVMPAEVHKVPDPHIDCARCGRPTGR